MESQTAPPIVVAPPFILPDQHGVAYSTAQLRGRRNLVLMLLPDLRDETVAFLATYAARHDEWAWLHTVVIAILPDTADFAAAAAIGMPVLRDHGVVRAALLPGAAEAIAAIMVANTDGQVTEWRTARRVSSLPDVDTALAWAWEVARPRGACDGGVAWARPTVSEAPSPTPIGRFTIGARHVGRSRFARGHRVHGAGVERIGHSAAR